MDCNLREFDRLFHRTSSEHRKAESIKKLIYAICFVLLFSGDVWGLDEATGSGLQVEVLTKSSSSWNGSQLPGYPAGTPEITILRISIPAGAELPLHEHPVINAGVLLKGQLTVITEDHRTLHLKAGDPIVEVVNTWHYGKNEGSEPAEILVVYAGVQGQPITVKKAEQQNVKQKDQQ